MGGFVNIDVNDLYSEIHSLMVESIGETEEEVTEAIYHAADVSAEALKEDIGKWSQTEDLPERDRLLYEKGWKAYKHKMREGHVEAVVANATAPSLTHLIENGHEKFVYGRDTGERTEPRNHIEKAYRKGAETLT